MYQDPNFNVPDLQTFAKMGNNAVAYMREISAEEMIEKFPDIRDVEIGYTYWAMFAADGTPLMLAGNESDLTDSAFYNDLTAVKLN